MIKTTKLWISENILYFAWLQALIGMVVSLYFSEILHFLPCVLCWYQRILLYPLVIILGVGIIRKDHHLHHYVLPFSILGMVAAFYHYLLQLGVIPEGIAPCTGGISCVTKYLEFFHFINIPFLSLLGFAFITVCMIIFKKSIKP